MGMVEGVGEIDERHEGDGRRRCGEVDERGEGGSRRRFKGSVQQKLRWV
jgi:hypothetical protein